MQNRKFATFFCAVQTFVAYRAKKVLDFWKRRSYTTGVAQYATERSDERERSEVQSSHRGARDFRSIELADAVGLSKSTLYRKINTGGDDFTIGEVLSITKALHLSADEGQQIFFAQNVARDATVKE